MPDIQEFDVVVVGGGSGLTAAWHASKAGERVALVEARPDGVGGTCVHRGCIPTKGLIQAAEVARAVREAHRFGVHVDPEAVRVDFAGIMDTVRERRAQDGARTREWVEKDLVPYWGRARFAGEKLLEMDDGRRLRGERVFLATGARPRVPPIPGLKDAGYLTNESALELREQPRHLVILGAGYIACEFGHFFSALGTRVTVVGRSGCLPREDGDVRELFEREFGARVELLLHAEASQAFREGDETGLLVRKDGAERRVAGDALLVATGRRANTEELALELSGVETDEHGWIRVDEHLCTTQPGIYAYGDVIGRAMFKHTSSYEGELAWRNSRGEALEVSYRANPHAVFSDPQVGSVGLTEEECREQGLAHRVSSSDYADVAKGRILGSPAGFAKALIEEESERILGFHMVGPGAAELVHEVVVAMNAGEGSAENVRRAIHVHPTLSELVRELF